MNYGTENLYIPKLVSTIVPVFNRANLIGKTLDSILNQTYPQIEVIAVNDGSTDDSLAILESYAQRHPTRIRIINQQNTGQARARNNGIRQARGEFIAFLDSDDTWDKEKLALQIPLFNGRVGLVYSAILEVDENDTITELIPCDPKVKGDIYALLLIANRMTGGSVVVTRQAIDNVGMFDESFPAAENWDLWIRVAKEYHIDYVDKPLVRYLRHSGNMSADQRLMCAANTAILHKHLPNRTTLPRELHRTFDTAYANFYYLQGIIHFSNGEYQSARKYFYHAWRYKMLYKDSALRVFRSFLGFTVNSILARYRKARH